MKQVLVSLLGLGFLIGFISSAEAINISLADVENGVAVVQGGKAAPNATITWEGGAVTKSNKNGGFSFSGGVPSDCVGSLSDGVTTLDVALTSCTPAPTAPTKAFVPQTGQTTSFDANNPQRDDGALQKGVPKPTPRFTDNGNGTITDNLTGLIWLKNANCPGTGDWQTALNDVASLNSAGTMNSNNCGDTSSGGSHQTDWRLPNVRELQSLVDYGNFNPALPTGAPFTSAQSVYWSSTTRAPDSNQAWVVILVDGGVTAGIKSGGSFSVLPVRGGS